MQDVLDLNNSDLLAVTVTSKQQPAGASGASGSRSSGSSGGSGSGSGSSGSGNPKQHRFLVVDVYQIVLVQPDATRLGWGVATFVGFLQVLFILFYKFTLI